METGAWQKWTGRVVVVDTDSKYVYLGTLDREEENFVILTGVDVHDRAEGPSTKEKYIIDAKRFGIKANRREVQIRKQVIVSLSLLEDVIEY